MDTTTLVDLAGQFGLQRIVTLTPLDGSVDEPALSSLFEEIDGPLDGSPDSFRALWRQADAETHNSAARNQLFHKLVRQAMQL